MQGRPIGEPVAKQGPFVMNTDEEIAQAFADYRSDTVRWVAVGSGRSHARDIVDSVRTPRRRTGRGIPAGLRFPRSPDSLPDNLRHEGTAAPVVTSNTA